MKVPLRWLSEYVDTGLTVEELAHRLTMAGLEAEKISVIGDDWDRIYIGHVEAVERHPDADRLVLATVDAGEHRLQVVTGAPNIAQGQTVALALAVGSARALAGWRWAAPAWSTPMSCARSAMTRTSTAALPSGSASSG